MSQSESEFYPLISIVIPTRNEAQDIGETLEAVLGMEYEPKEILVVDDSTDNTPEIVSRYADRGVHLIHREQNRNGCCGARNLGMQMAKGEIIVIFNADNRPKPDFLDRLLKHYESGADYVIVRSLVLNQENMWGKYAHATDTYWLSTNPPMEWSEGFSCRRSAAQEVSYIPGDFPVLFCRDWMFGAALNQAGFRKHVDLGIEVKHIVPSTSPTYWRNQLWRGTFSAPFTYYIGKKPVAFIVIREALKAGRTLLRYLLVLPALWRVARLSSYTPNRWRDAPGLILVALVQDWATVVGNLQGVVRLIRTLRRG
jgi:glycosyltransferase involved in cell wall biosynthesis